LALLLVFRELIPLWRWGWLRRAATAIPATITLYFTIGVLHEHALDVFQGYATASLTWPRAVASTFVLFHLPL
jgi:hypothetical protein